MLACDSRTRRACARGVQVLRRCMHACLREVVCVRAYARALARSASCNVALKCDLIFAGPGASHFSPAWKNDPGVIFAGVKPPTKVTPPRLLVELE